MTSRTAFSALFTDVLRLSVLVALPVGVGLWLTAGPVLRLVFGADFVEAAPTLRIVAWTSVLYFISVVVFNTLESSDRQRLATLILASIAVCNTAFNALLIPGFSYEGAAVATLLTQAVGLLLSLALVLQYIDFRRLASATLRTLAAGAVMGLAVFLLHDLDVILLAGLAALVYGVAAIVFKAVRPEDVRLLRQTLRLGRRNAANAPIPVSADGRG
jgi:O-antigen/teichoic acid export membrane protein